jgi:hypothetical protein
MEAEATVAMRRDAERQGDQLLGLLRQRAGQLAFDNSPKPFMKAGKSTRRTASCPEMSRVRTLHPPFPSDPEFTHASTHSCPVRRQCRVQSWPESGVRFATVSTAMSSAKTTIGGTRFGALWRTRSRDRLTKGSSCSWLHRANDAMEATCPTSPEAPGSVQ